MTAHVAECLRPSTICGAIVQAADLVDVGSRQQLFIDDALIASSKAIELTMNRPAKSSDMTITGERPWEQLGVSVGSIVLKATDASSLLSFCQAYSLTNQRIAYCLESRRNVSV